MKWFFPLAVLFSIVKYNLSWFWRWNAVQVREVPVACPCCKNKRLFDVNPKTIGEIKIKCQICKSIIKITLYSEEIRTEQIDA